MKNKSNSENSSENNGYLGKISENVAVRVIATGILALFGYIFYSTKNYKSIELKRLIINFLFEDIQIPSWGLYLFILSIGFSLFFVARLKIKLSSSFLDINKYISDKYKILRQKDVPQEWNYIIEKVDEYSTNIREKISRFRTPTLSRVVIHFYHEPKDTQEVYIRNNIKLIEKGFIILWVYEENNSDFEKALRRSMGNEYLSECEFMTMDRDLARIPINFTVIAPLHSDLPLVYVRLEDLDFALRIDSRGPTILLFDKLGCYCIEKLKKYNPKTKWNDLLGV